VLRTDGQYSTLTPNILLRVPPERLRIFPGGSMRRSVVPVPQLDGRHWTEVYEPGKNMLYGCVQNSPARLCVLWHVLPNRTLMMGCRSAVTT